MSVFYDDASHGYVCAETGDVLDSVTQVIKAARRRRGEWMRYPQHTRDRGHDVHAFTAAYDLNLPLPDLRPEWMGYALGWQQWCGIFRPTWQRVECIVADKARRIAGTIDRIGIVNARPAIVDVKTTAAWSRWHEVQVAGYADILGVEDIDRILVYISANGKQRTVKVPVGAADLDWQMVLSERVA